VKKTIIRVYIFLLIILNTPVFSQNSVSVTFCCYPSGENVVRAFVPGTFNNWGPNSNGRIYLGSLSQMTFIDSLCLYVKKQDLTEGSTYEYKFYEHYNDSGTDYAWITDPLNPGKNSSNYNNSVLHIKKGFIFEIAPGNGSIINDSRPVFSASLCIDAKDSILTNQSEIFIDNVFYGNVDDIFIPELSIVHSKLPYLNNGLHSVRIEVKTLNGLSFCDSTEFSVKAGGVYFVTPDIDSLLAPVYNVRWKVETSQKAVKKITFNQIGRYPINFTPKSSGLYEYAITASHGRNQYQVIVEDTAGAISYSDTLNLVYPVSKKPAARIDFELQGDDILLNGICEYHYGQKLSYIWKNQDTNSLVIEEAESCTTRTVRIPKPVLPGDYSFKLTIYDENGDSGSAVNFFTVNRDSTVTFPDYAAVPQWVRDTRIYSLFFKSFTAEATIAAATQKLDYIKDMGFNVIWVLPVMDVEGEIDRNTNIGYNIINLYKIEPSYGTSEDFRQFVKEAHRRGLRVILDVTPNHVSRSHPIALDVRSKGIYSRYYDFFQHKIIPHNDNGLGQTISQDGIVYYTGFSSALLNWNWSDDEARKYMIDVYSYWLREYDIDGFRFDVYWGPHRRYGREDFDIHLREALRKQKADIFLLGETSGTGEGTAAQYADKGGGIDAAYDWVFSGTVASFPSVVSLDGVLYNSGFRPGQNSYFLRFLENHDELRVAYRYNSINKTIPVSTAMFLSTGIPMIWQGQEVGMGYEMTGSKEYLARSIVQWDLSGREKILVHYQKLAQIRKQFPAFGHQPEDTNGDNKINSADENVIPRLSTSDSKVFAFARPWKDRNGLVVINMGPSRTDVQVNLNLANWAKFSHVYSGDNKYFLNDLYNNNSIMEQGKELDTLSVNLGPYDVAVFTISCTKDSLILPEIKTGFKQDNEKHLPAEFQLMQNFPNPFNGETAINYNIVCSGEVELSIFNIRGQRIKTIINKHQNPGFYSVSWNGRDDGGLSVSSGIYLCVLRFNKIINVKKLILSR